MIYGIIVLSLVVLAFIFSLIGQTNNKGSLVKASRVLGDIATLVCLIGYAILR